MSSCALASRLRCVPSLPAAVLPLFCAFLYLFLTYSLALRRATFLRSCQAREPCTLRAFYLLLAVPCPTGLEWVLLRAHPRHPP